MLKTLWLGTPNLKLSSKQFKLVKNGAADLDRIY